MLQVHPQLMAARIKQIRKHQGMTQLEFSQLLGVTSRTVQHWEAGTTEPRVQQLRRLSGIASKPIAWFYEEEAA